mmetsp:Transcript_29251/g.5283  ORF Transcript_29251/g.5283 Transcript_29251/m.5283 type:complete len:82 (+) Transcript_29251:556-801(+)
MEHYGATPPSKPTGTEISADDPHYASKIEMMYSVYCEESKQKRIREIQERYEKTVIEYNKRRGFEQGIKRHFFHSKSLDEN